MRIAVVAGGVGGARFTRGLRDLGENDLSIIVNVGDDAWVDGLRVCPDLDSQMYALAGIHDSDRGWGRRGDSMRIDAELRAWDFGARWFTLGDLDIAAHIMRTAMLHEGSALTEATDRLCSRWNLGARPATIVRRPGSTAPPWAARSISRSGGCDTGPSPAQQDFCPGPGVPSCPMPLSERLPWRNLS